MEIGGGIEASAQRTAAGVEDVAAAVPVGADEVEVIAADLDPLRVGGEAEAEHRPLDVLEVEDVLVGGDLGERAIGRALGRHRARPHQLEATVEADRAGGRPLRQQSVERRQQPVVRARPRRQALVAVEPVDGAEAEVAVLGQLGEAEVALIGALEQHPDR